jgi:S-DNA-T family DNA segregation ATPase FtsK/SpoIIIE
MIKYISFFIYKNLNYFIGFINLCIAVFLLLSIFSYHNADPSFNKATFTLPKNYGGFYGAFLADPILQLFGASSLYLIIHPFIWGIWYLINSRVNFFLIKFCFAIIALLALSGLLNMIPSIEWWQFNGFGGIIGDIIYSKLTRLLQSSYLSFLTLLLGCIISTVLALPIHLKSWKNFIVYLYKIFYSTLFFILKTLRVLTNETVRVKFFGESPTVELEEEYTESVSKPVKKLKVNITPQKENSFDKKKNASFNSHKFRLPSTSLLSLPSDKKRRHTPEGQLTENAENLMKVLKDFGIKGEITDIHPGPVVTLYEFKPSAGTKSSRVIGLSEDIARSMSATSARISVIPGKDALGIELPNLFRETVYLRELLESKEYKSEAFNLPIILGKDISGEAKVVELSKMPHLLVAGTTGSGKSVAINTMILSLIYHLSPNECKFIMIDPKMLELSIYDNIPHLLTPVVTDPGKAVTALKWAVREMENRYKLMSHLSVRNIAGYNSRIEEAIAKKETLEKSIQIGYAEDSGKPIYEKISIPLETLPFIVVIVDEMADLMLVAGKEIETSIQRLAQMARAAGIHIIMATQRPSVDVITGVIKANFPTRISFQVTSKIDSRTILGEQGAEQLLGMGDMLYMSGGSRITRVHGPFVSDEEVEKIVSYLKSQGTPSYIDDITKEEDNDDSSTAESFDEDDPYHQAVLLVKREGKASTSYLQRCLRIGYNKAALLIERMEKEGIVSKADHVGRREVLVQE